jgi:hypothetical protein
MTPNALRDQVKKAARINEALVLCLASAIVQGGLLMGGKKLDLMWNIYM